MDTNENVRKEISLCTIRIRRVDHSCRFCSAAALARALPSSFTHSEKAPSIERTICPLDHFPLHRCAGDSDRAGWHWWPWVLSPSLCPKRRRILVREKVTKNWNGKSTECPFPRWSDGRGEEKGGRGVAAAEPKRKRGATSTVALTLM